MTGIISDKALFKSSAEDTLNNNVNLADGLRVQLIRLHNLRKLRSCDLLYFQVSEDRFNVIPVLSFISVCGTFFQLDRSIVCEIPVGKLRELHILIKLAESLAVIFKFNCIGNRKLFSFLR